MGSQSSLTSKKVQKIRPVNRMRRRRQPTTVAEFELRRSWTEYLESSIERFTTAAQTFATTLASHNERLDATDEMAKTLQQDLRELRTQQTQRIETVQKDLSLRIDTVQKDLVEKMDAQTTALTEHFDKGISMVGKRLTALERWRILIVGGSIVIGFIVVDILARILLDGPVLDAFLHLFR